MQRFHAKSQARCILSAHTVTTLVERYKQYRKITPE